jgi:hypothetical protein
MARSTRKRISVLLVFDLNGNQEELKLHVLQTVRDAKSQIQMEKRKDKQSRVLSPSLSIKLKLRSN